MKTGYDEHRLFLIVLEDVVQFVRSEITIFRKNATVYKKWVNLK